MNRNASARKNRFAGGVLACLVLLLSVLVNLPCRYVERGGGWVGRQQFSDNDSSRRMDELPVMAGWPLRYWVRYDRDGQNEDRVWSLVRLSANVLIGMCAASCVFAFTLFRARVIGANQNRRMAHSILDCIVAIFVVSLPLTAFAWACGTRAQHSRLIDRTGAFGNAYVAAWVPELLASRLPVGLLQTMERVRYVKFRAPTDDVIRAYAELDTLTGFDFIGGRYDASSIDAFSSNVHFAFVRLRHRQVNDRIAQSLAKFPWLLELDLSDTNLDSELYRRFDSMPSLRWVDLRGTEVRLAQIGKPKWASTVQSLLLPPSPVGGSDELVLDGWAELESLAILRSSFVVNDSAVTLRLSRLPKLTTLSLNRLQKYALYVNDLPRLSRVDEDVSTLLFTLGADEFAPGLTWLSALHLDGVPSLTNLGCFARDLNSLSISNAPNLRRLEIGSYVIFASEAAGLVPINAGDRQAWIDELGGGDGPVIVDLTGLPLEGIDLSPLVANPRIRHLQLGNSGVTFEQVLGLQGMAQLQVLDLGDCPLKEDQLGWLLSHLPSLESLRVNVTMLETVALTRDITLRELRTTQFERLRDLRIVDVPGLTCYLRLVRTPDRLVIKNAPLLRGFALEQPWPADALISGLRDLEWFSAGGSDLDDSVVDELLQCQTLDRLTLAYTSVSPEKLTELGRLDGLVSLVLPGSPVDDQVTAHWRPLRRLQQINLSDSLVSAGTFQWLATIDSLRQLSLNRIALNDRAAASLFNLAQVAELEIADVQMDPKWLIAILNQHTLERIDVSGWKLDPPLVDALANCESLESLRVSRCEMSGEALLQIAAANSSLQIELGESRGQFSADVLALLGSRIEPPQSLRQTLDVIATDTIFYEVIGDANSREPVAAVDRPPKGIWAFHEAQPGTIDAERFRQTQ
jgi:hypothetical protein